MATFCFSQFLAVEQADKQTQKKGQPGDQEGEELEQSAGHLVGNHHRRFKGRVSVVVLLAAALMTPWEDAAISHVREEST